MAKGGSFWSSIPGFLTGLAGVLTAVVTLVTLAFSQGWIGDGAATDSKSSAAGTGAAAPDPSVEPESVRFTPTLLVAVTEAVKVTNEGDDPFSVDSVQITGSDRGRFSVDGGQCVGTPLPSGQSCELVISYEPSGAGQARATLVVSARAENGEKKAAEAVLEGVGAG